MSSNTFKPIKTKLEKDRPYFWCTCGLSEKQPLCDGKHKSTELKPLNFTVDETKDYFLCSCKKTKKKPFCDGSHK
jgi:CDGSH-type Zn-finger protein